MLLHKLVQGFNTAPAVDEKVKELLTFVQKIPETLAELTELIKYAQVNPLLADAPDVNVDAINAQLAACRQVLIATDNYYYI